jgi:hypothetical protein
MTVAKTATLEILRSLSAQHDNVAVLDLSRNFGKEIALTAGLDHADGDAIIVNAWTWGGDGGEGDEEAKRRSAEDYAEIRRLSSTFTNDQFWEMVHRLESECVDVPPDWLGTMTRSQARTASLGSLAKSPPAPSLSRQTAKSAAPAQP